jgi:ribosomal-protein-alanine N-acetyltransferase
LKKHHYILPIASERLYFQFLSENDTTGWEAFFINNEQLHFVGIKHPESPSIEAHKWIQRQIERYTETGVGMLGAYLKSNDQLIGNCGLVWRQGILGEDLYEIGYGVIPEYWGKGYASEMSASLMQYFLDQQLGTKVISIIDTENLASQRVALKNGMSKGAAFVFKGSHCLQYYRLLSNH